MRPLHRSRFQIAAVGQAEDQRPLVAVSRACLEWAFDRFPAPNPGGPKFEDLLEDPLRSARLENPEGARIEIVSLEEDRLTTWAIRFSHLQWDDQDIRYTTEIAIRERAPGALDVVVKLLVSREGSGVAPVHLESSTPGIVRQLVTWFPCHVGHPLSFTARTMEVGKIPDLVERVNSPRRKLPLVILNKPAVAGLFAPDMLAKALCAQAHVFCADGRWALEKLDGHLPLGMNVPEEAAVRLYWPVQVPRDGVAPENQPFSGFTALRALDA